MTTVRSQQNHKHTLTTSMAVEEAVRVITDDGHLEDVECEEEGEEELVVFVSFKSQEPVSIVDEQGTSSISFVSVNMKRDQVEAYKNETIIRATGTISLINRINYFRNYMQT